MKESAGKFKFGLSCCDYNQEGKTAGKFKFFQNIRISFFALELNDPSPFSVNIFAFFYKLTQEKCPENCTLTSAQTLL